MAPKSDHWNFKLIFLLLSNDCTLQSNPFPVIHLTVRPDSSPKITAMMAWICLFSGLSDLSSSTTPQPMSPMNLQNSLYALQHQAKQLKDDCRGIRRAQVAFQDTMRETINDTLRRIREVLPGIPGADELPIRAQRLAMDCNSQEYKVDAIKIETDLK